MDPFLEQIQSTKFTKFYKRKKIDIMSRPISIKNIESLINNLPKQKAPGPDEFTSKFYQIFKEEIVPFFYGLFQITEVEETLPNSLY